MLLLYSCWLFLFLCLRNVFFKSLAHLLTSWILFWSWILCIPYLCLDINPLADIRLANIHSHSVVAVGCWPLFWVFPWLCYSVLGDLIPLVYFWSCSPGFGVLSMESLPMTAPYIFLVEVCNFRSYDRTVVLCVIAGNVHVCVGGSLVLAVILTPSLPCFLS